MAMTTKRWFVRIALLFGLAAGVGAQAQDVYSFSVAPQFERRVLFGIWQPIVDELQRRTGKRFELVTSLSVADYEREVGEGRYDFIYINPYAMPTVGRKPGYVPLVRAKEPLRGILVVRKDSPYRAVAELQGKTLAVPSLSALGASLLLRAELDRRFHVRPGVVVARSHPSVFLHVINGLTEAGGSVQKALAEAEPEVRDTLRVLYRTDPAPSHPLAAHKRVPEPVREQVRQAFLDMSASEAGRKLLAGIPMQEAVAARLEDYDGLRKLKLEQYLAEP